MVPLGAVPYDGFMLPLVSPDGRHIATQVDAPPAWATVLAEHDAVPPYATRIAVYRLDVRSSVEPADRVQPELVASIDGIALLGRSADREGFLIESPRESGARWIGKVAWTSGDITWLVQDEMVNAFAALAPDGRLAWSRRAIDASGFDLIVRDTSGEQWTIPHGGGDWLMPTWSSVGNGLYALHRQNGQLRMCYGPAQGERAFRSALRDFALIAESDRYAAYQALISQGSLDGALGVAQPHLFILHPGLGRMVMWRPFAPRESAATILNDRSLVALQHATDSVVVCLRDELLLQSLRDPDSSIVLSKGMWIPRRTPAAETSYLLLSPQGDGMVGLAGISLLPVESPPQAAPGRR